MDPGAFLINRTLERERWARDKLALHAGRTVSFKLGPASVTWKIDESGSFHETKESPDLTLTLSPLRLPSLLAQPARWHELVEASGGDSALATTLEELSLTLPMLVEQAFTRALGPIAGAFVADTGRRMLGFPEYAAQRFGESVARYAVDESALAVRASEVSAFATDVAAVNLAIGELSVRLDALDAAERKSVR